MLARQAYNKSILRLGPEIGYPNWDISLFSSLSPKKLSGQ
jgi:hypothetical protein